MPAAAPRSSSRDSRGHQLVEQGVGTERRTKPELDPRMKPAQAVSRGGQVAEQVDARGEEIGDHQDPGCSPGHAPASSGRDVGIGQLEEAGLDDRISPGPRPGGQVVQVVVGRGLCRLPWAIRRMAVSVSWQPSWRSSAIRASCDVPAMWYSSDPDRLPVAPPSTASHPVRNHRFRRLTSASRTPRGRAGAWASRPL